MSSSRYLKPAGYKSYLRGYPLYNNAILGNMAYSPGPPTAEFSTFTFTGVPDDLSTITVPDGPYTAPGGTVFTFTYGGSAGPGIIPLAVGGGTAVNAKIAAFNTLTAQLTRWTPVSVSALIFTLTSQQPGMFVGPSLGGNTNITLENVIRVFQSVLPARIGRNFAFLSGT